MGKNPFIRNIKQASDRPLDHQSAGILDDHAIRKTIALLQGTIEHTPANDSDIANKKYVDDNAGGVEVNDLTSAVTWANVPDANITESSVTQHVGAIDHDSLLNTHNLTTNIDHDALTNFVANEHIDWTSTSSNFNTSGTAATGVLTATGEMGVTTTGAGGVIKLERTGAAPSTYTITNLSDLITHDYVGGSGGIKFAVESDVKMVIAENGDVGIGSATPAKIFHVTSVADGIRNETTGANSDSQLQLKNDAQQWNIENRGGDSDKLRLSDGNGGTSPLIIEKTTPTNTLYLDSTGNVGIGTNSPTSKLEITKDTAGTTNLTVVKNVASGTVPVVLFLQDHTSGAQPVLQLDQDDISEGFIDFIGSARGVVTSGNSAQSVRVELNGTKYVIPLFADQ